MGGGKRKEGREEGEEEERESEMKRGGTGEWERRGR